MLDFRFQSGIFAQSLRAIGKVLRLSLCGCAVLLVTVPLTRSSELNELTSQRERIEEDSTFANRVENEKHLRLAHGVTTILQPTRPLIGHAQRSVLDPLPGHRLSNGLLAPITC